MAPVRMVKCNDKCKCPGKKDVVTTLGKELRDPLPVLFKHQTREILLS